MEDTAITKVITPPIPAVCQEFDGEDRDLCVVWASLPCKDLNKARNNLVGILKSPMAESQRASLGHRLTDIIVPIMSAKECVMIDAEKRPIHRKGLA